MQTYLVTLIELLLLTKLWILLNGSETHQLVKGIYNELCFYLALNTSLVLFYRYTISIRDILTWVDFVNICVKHVNVGEAYIHGACLAFLDSLGSGITGTER